jgi:carbonic anhydrase/acetyltransferase-like protein (isoleucine patch superfamily)
MPGPLILPWKGVMPRIAADAFIAPNATIIGDVEIGSQASVWFNCVLRADVSFIRIGARTNIQDGTIIHEAHKSDGVHDNSPAIIGNDVIVGHNVVLHACKIGDGAFIGMSSTILDRAVIESQAMIAAGALVSVGKTVPSGELWAGMPAKFMRKLRDQDFAEFKRNSASYVEAGAAYLKELGGKA